MRALNVKWFLAAGVLLFTCLVAYRAVVIPVTHDEASTWLSFRLYNMWSCYENYYCWQTANNHWLNSVLMQWSGGLFGDHIWALRLPNVVAGFLYFIAAALLSLRYIQSSWLPLCGFLLITSHLYLLDFFSLCRGYGLMVCGVLWGIYFIMRYIERFEIRWLICCVLALSIAVLSNFTALLPMASIGTVWFIWILLQKKGLLISKHSWVWVFAAIILVWWSAYPIRILANAGEFALGAKNTVFMIQDLLGNLLYGSQYVGFKTPGYFSLFLFALISFFAVFTLIVKRSNSTHQLLLILALLVINLGFVEANQFITGSSAPMGRRTIYFIPLLFLPLALGLDLISHKTIKYTLGVLISLMMLYQTIRPPLWTAVREWYYDAYYPDLFSALPAFDTRDSIRLGASWIFTPSLLFYQQTKELPIAGLQYQKPLVIDSIIHYYYVEAIDTVQMSAFGFVLQKNIGPYFLFSNIPDPLPPEAPSH